MHVIRGSLAVDKYALQKRYIVVLEAKVVRVPVLNSVYSKFYYVEHLLFRPEHSQL
jgi:hypothetical protein